MRPEYRGGADDAREAASHQTTSSHHHDSNRAAPIAGVSTKTIRRRIAHGSISGYRFGPRVIRVDLNEVESLFTQMPTAKRWGK
jgi:hypothetical protein